MQFSSSSHHIVRLWCAICNLSHGGDDRLLYFGYSLKHFCLTDKTFWTYRDSRLTFQKGFGALVESLWISLLQSCDKLRQHCEKASLPASYSPRHMSFCVVAGLYRFRIMKCRKWNQDSHFSVCLRRHSAVWHSGSMRPTCNRWSITVTDKKTKLLPYYLGLALKRCVWRDFQVRISLRAFQKLELQMLQPSTRLLERWLH